MGDSGGGATMGTGKVKRDIRLTLPVPHYHYVLLSEGTSHKYHLSELKSQRERSERRNLTAVETRKAQTKAL